MCNTEFLSSMTPHHGGSLQTLLFATLTLLRQTLPNIIEADPWVAFTINQKSPITKNHPTNVHTAQPDSRSPQSCPVGTRGSMTGPGLLSLFTDCAQPPAHHARKGGPKKQPRAIEHLNFDVHGGSATQVGAALVAWFGCQLGPGHSSGSN